MFFLSKIDSTQELSTAVIAAPADAQSSTVSRESLDWVQRCDNGAAFQRVPFVLGDTKIQVRDIHGNKRQLTSADTLKVLVHQSEQLDFENHFSDWIL